MGEKEKPKMTRRGFIAAALAGVVAGKSTKELKAAKQFIPPVKHNVSIDATGHDATEAFGIFSAECPAGRLFEETTYIELTVKDEPTKH